MKYDAKAQAAIHAQGDSVHFANPFWEGIEMAAEDVDRIFA